MDDDVECGGDGDRRDGHLVTSDDDDMATTKRVVEREKKEKERERERDALEKGREEER